MRFHIGCSFSLRKLKKFIFPILLGLFSYFFGDYFFGGYINVLAATNTNLDTRFNVIYEEVDYSSIQIDQQGHSVQDFFDNVVALARASEYYDTIIFANTFNPLNQAYSVRYKILLIEKNTINSSNYSTFFGIKSSYYAGRSRFVGIYSDYSAYAFPTNQFVIHLDSYYYDDYHNMDRFDSLTSCLLENTGCSNLSSSSLNVGGDFQLSSSINFSNSSSSTFDLFDRAYLNTTGSGGIYAFGSQTTPYFSTFPLVLSNSYIPVSTEDIFFKNISINEVNYSVGDIIPTYCQLYSLCDEEVPGLTTYNYLDDIFVSNIPTNNYTNLELKFSFNYFNSNFYDNFHIQGLFYGRVNNGTYYSYEPISCSLTGGSAFGDFVVNGTYRISSCSSNLSNYDSIILRARMTTLDLITNFTFSTNVGHINIAPVYNGSNNVEIMDYFGSLGPDFSVLISSTESSVNLEFKGNDRYTFAQRINKATNEISALAQTGVISFGSSSNSNVMIYNYSLENNTNTDLYLFFSENVIVSFSDNGSYTYYDDSNTINTENITIKYLIDISQYDSTAFIDIIDNFLNDLDSSLIDCHNLLNTLYNNLPP